MSKGNRYRDHNDIPGIPRNRMPRVLAAESAEFHLFRLESFCQGLHDLCTAAGNGRKLDRRRLLAVAGAHFIAEIPGEAGFIRRALELGSRICNQALDALRQEGRERRLSERDVQRSGGHVLTIRDLLVALHDLLEANQYRYDYPHERDAAHRHLATLLNVDADTPQKRLIDTCFEHGGGLAAQALEVLFAAR